MLKLLFGAGACSLSAFYQLKSVSAANTSEQNQQSDRKAICILYPDNNSGVSGIVSFNQQDYTSRTKIVAHVRGLKPNSLHGFHIHEFGDLTEGCITAGSHYNPYNTQHGDPISEKRHVGDLGNLKTDENGIAYLATTDPLIKLFGEQSVVGRSCVVHADEDDLGRGNYPDSLTTGHAGPRLACGVIGLSAKFKNIPPPEKS